MKSNAVGGIKANKGTPKRWYAKNRVILLLIILFFPLGLTLMWKYGDWTRKTKWIITVTVGLILTLGMIGSYNAAPYITVNNAKSNKINTDNSEYLLTGDVSSMKASTLTIENKSVNLSEDSEFTYRVSLLEGDNTFHLVANNANGQTEKVLTIHRTTKAEFAARTEAEKLAAEKRALDESKKEAEAIAKAKKDSNKKTNSSCWWIFCQSDEDKASQDKLA
ncbi:MAG: hypothetical protein QG549_176, partial [Patescibacteria group bacterium]|nr:hypothetical protein [Patescibacteria group bacterium]